MSVRTAAGDEAIDHPDDFQERLPDRPDPDKIRELSRLTPHVALGAIAVEWLGIAWAIYLCEQYWHPLVYLVAVAFIGTRQHALLVIGHDASHYTLFKNRWLNDHAANLLLFWPTFTGVETFRYFHRDHHRYLETEKDGNRQLWRTHDAAGNLKEEWVYPKSAGALFLKLAAKAAFVRGMRWVLLGMLAPFGKKAFRRDSWGYAIVRTGYYAVVFLAFYRFDLWWPFLLYWLIPFCTWQIVAQYIRLICEHSAVESAVKPYHMTRTTLPRLWERWFILPRNIGYHHEHHWYPSVPFYKLPLLHKILKEETQFGRHATYAGSVWEALCQCMGNGWRTVDDGS